MKIYSSSILFNGFAGLACRLRSKKNKICNLPWKLAACAEFCKMVQRFWKITKYEMLILHGEYCRSRKTLKATTKPENSVSILENQSIHKRNFFYLCVTLAIQPKSPQIGLGCLGTLPNVNRRSTQRKAYVAPRAPKVSGQGALAGGSRPNVLFFGRRKVLALFLFAR